MFEVLVYLYENYSAFAACPDAKALVKKLSAAGFEEEEISDALAWLQGLAQVTQTCVTLDHEPSDGFRVYNSFEYERLGAEAIGFLTFLEHQGSLSASQREIVIERVLATEAPPVSLAKLKVIVLMVLWSLRADIDVLMLEELLDDGGSAQRLH